ncbi:hypothetical protein [Mycoplasma sp. ATU-Cv-703]|uniref:hypothetical protein n=1 Tax=Mycoplasma sp. ATU-Cv-703 TaxID=2498595 RepID=UPI000FDDCD7B
MPKFFLVEKNVFLNKDQLLCLETFYQPIIGLEPTSLYRQLLGYAKIARQSQNYLPFQFIGEALNIGEKQIEAALQVLGGVGLLRTYVSQDQTQTLIVINRPLERKKFLENRLLINLLQKKVSPEFFQYLTLSLDQSQFAKQKMVENTAKFPDVFGTQALNLEANDNTLEIDIARFKNPQEAINSLPSAQYFHYLTNRRPSPSLLAVLEQINKLGYLSPIVNTIIHYSFEVNDGKVIANHVLKIAQDLKHKQINHLQEVQSELTRARESKLIFNSTDTLIETCDSTPKGQQKINLKKLFEDLGEF